MYVVAPPPPNVADSPDALCCKRMQTIRITHVIASIVNSNLTIYSYYKRIVKKFSIINYHFSFNIQIIIFNDFRNTDVNWTLIHWTLNENLKL